MRDRKKCGGTRKPFFKHFKGKHKNDTCSDEWNVQCATPTFFVLKFHKCPCYDLTFQTLFLASVQQKIPRASSTSIAANFRRSKLLIRIAASRKILRQIVVKWKMLQPHSAFISTLICIVVKLHLHRKIAAIKFNAKYLCWHFKVVRRNLYLARWRWETANGSYSINKSHPCCI